MSSATLREMLIATSQLQETSNEEEVFQGILFGRSGRPQVGSMQNTYKSQHKNNEGGKKPAAKKEKKTMSTTTRETATEKKNNEATTEVLRGLDENTVAARKLTDRLDNAAKSRRIDNERELVSNASLVVGGVSGGLIAKFGFKMTNKESIEMGALSGVASMAAANCLHTVATAIINRPKKAKPAAEAPKAEEPKAESN